MKPHCLWLTKKENGSRLISIFPFPKHVKKKLLCLSLIVLIGTFSLINLKWSISFFVML